MTIIVLEVTGKKYDQGQHDVTRYWLLEHSDYPAMQRCVEALNYINDVEKYAGQIERTVNSSPLIGSKQPPAQALYRRIEANPRDAKVYHMKVALKSVYTEEEKETRKELAKARRLVKQLEGIVEGFNSNVGKKYDHLQRKI